MNEIQDKKLFGYIYLTTNLIDNKKYIGKRTCSADERSKKWRQGLYLGSGVILKKALKRYGRKNFSRVILCNCYSLIELNQKEQFFIEQYHALNNPEFYNIAKGGDGGSVLDLLPPEKARAAWDKAAKSRIGRVVSEETRQKERESHKNQKPTAKCLAAVSMYARNHRASPETRKKISEAGKGRKCPEWLKQKLRSERKGVTVISPKQREQISQTLSKTLTGHICVYKGDVEKHIYKDQLDGYLKDGWLLGVTERHKQACSQARQRCFQRKSGL